MEHEWDSLKITYDKRSQNIDNMLKWQNTLCYTLVSRNRKIAGKQPQSYLCKLLTPYKIYHKASELTICTDFIDYNPVLFMLTLSSSFPGQYLLWLNRKSVAPLPIDISQFYAKYKLLWSLSFLSFIWASSSTVYWIPSETCSFLFSSFVSMVYCWLFLICERMLLLAMT